MSTIYTLMPGGTNLSQFLAEIEKRHELIRGCERGSTEPTVKVRGQLWLCTDTVRLLALGLHAGITEAYLMWDGAVWRFKLDAEHPPLMVSGENSPVANIPWGGFLITGLGEGSASGHSVRYEQVVLRSGALAWTGNQNAGGFKITNLAAGTAGSSDAARMSDIPNASGQVWFGRNRHGTAGHVVAYLDEGSGIPADYNTVAGFCPRHLRVRLSGRFYRQSDDAIGQAVDTTVEFDRHDADSTGGFAGTPTTQTLLLVYGAGNDMEVTVTWIAGGSGVGGFRLEFRDESSGDAYYLRNISNSAVDGSIQVLALGDPGGG